MGNKFANDWLEVSLPEMVGPDGVFVDGDWIESKDQDVNGDVRLIQLADIGVNEFRNRSSRYLTNTKAVALKCTFLKKGDILVARMPDPIGRACIFNEEGKSVTVVDVAIIRPNNKNINNRWLVYSINSPQINKAINDLASGSTRQRISRKNLAQITFPLPPLEDQKRIVQKLDKLFAHLEKIKERLDQIPELLKQFRQAVLTQAVTGRLTEEWSKKSKWTSIEKTLRSIETLAKPRMYLSRNKSIIEGELAISVGSPNKNIPSRYKWTELVSIAKLETGHTPSRNFDSYWNGSINWVGIKDAKNHHGKTIFETEQKVTQLGIDNSAARVLPIGTVCLSRTASVGYVVVLGKEMSTSQDFVNWICSDAIKPNWLKILLMAEKNSILKFGKGTTHTTIYFPEVISLYVALPPIEEQLEIIQRVETLFSKADAIEQRHKKLKEQIVQLQPALLAKAFRGELD